MDKSRVAKVWKALAEYGIYSERDLDEAMKTMTPINIGCMVSPIPIRKASEGEEKRLLDKIKK